MQNPSKQAKRLVFLIAVRFNTLQPDTVTERTTQVKTAHPVDLYFPKIAQCYLPQKYVALFLLAILFS